MVTNTTTSSLHSFRGAMRALLEEGGDELGGGGRRVLERVVWGPGADGADAQIVPLARRSMTTGSLGVPLEPSR
ncbi:hypothetical protein BAC2_00520 [uncultured bacterium]|nr:hypothetical protein BAC2_00520 [uncultured bacterium]